MARTLPSAGWDTHVPRRRLVLAVAALAAVVGISGSAQATWRYALRYSGLDFFQFWVVGQATDGELSPYSESTRRTLTRELPALPTGERDAERLRRAASRRTVLETYSTPSLYWMFRVGTSADYESAYRQFQLISIVAALAAIGVLARLSGHAWLVVIVAVTLIPHVIDPFLDDARVGNVNRLQLFLLAGFLLLRLRDGKAWADLSAGALLGGAVTFKPNLALVPLILGIGWLTAARYRSALRVGGGLLIGVAGSVFLSSYVFGGPGVWIEWVRAVRSLPADIIPVGMGNLAPSLVVAESLGLPTGRPIAFGLLATVLLLVVLVFRRSPVGSNDTRGDVLLTGLGTAVYLLSAPLVWTHYYVLATPLILFNLRPCRRSSGGTAGWCRLRQLAAVLAAVLLSRKLFLRTPHEAGWGAAISVLLLVFAALIDRWYSSRGTR